MPKLLPSGLFTRLRMQMMLLLAGGLLVVDVVVLLGVIRIQAAVVDDSLDAAASRISDLPAELPNATIGLVDALSPSDLYVAYIGADGKVLTSSAPVSTDDTPQVNQLLDSGELRLGESITRDAPEGTPYELLAVPLPRETDIQLEEGRVTTSVTSVVLGYPKSAMEATTRRLLLIEIGSGIVVLTTAYLLSGWFVRAGLRPLRRIGRTARAIATGRTGERVEVDGNDAELRDVAEALNEAFDVRQDSEDRMRDFVADASHELRTPLASVRGWTDLYLEGGIGDREGIDTAMRTIYQEAGRMELLVEDLLMLARYDAGADVDSAVSEPTPVAPLLADLVDSVGLLHPDHTYDIGRVAEGARVRADPVSLRRAVSNLMVNAGRHTPPGTRVEVSTVEIGGHVEIRVSDDGPGLTAAEREAAFDRFWRGDRSRGRRPDARSGGTGLGLAISQSILRAAGGDLRLEQASTGGLAAVVVLVGAD